MVASGGGLSEGYGHDGPGICLGDGQTEAYLKDMRMTGLASAWAMARNAYLKDMSMAGLASVCAMARRRPKGVLSHGGRAAPAYKPPHLT